MALVVFDTICLLACGFYLYVLLQWRREDKAAFRFAGDRKSGRTTRNAPLNVVSFRRDANRGRNRGGAQVRWSGVARPADAEGSPNCSQCERIAHERIARAGVTWRRE
jgi:hypothetical protein